MKKRGQISIELVITIGFALLIIIPLTLLLYEYTIQRNQEINSNQAGLIARKITDAADSVYYIGYPTTKSLKIYMPEDIESINISGRTIIFRLTTGLEEVSVANINLTGYISPTSGRKHLIVSALEYMVNISEDVN